MCVCVCVCVCVGGGITHNNLRILHSNIMPVKTNNTWDCGWTPAQFVSVDSGVLVLVLLLRSTTDDTYNIQLFLFTHSVVELFSIFS